MVIARKVAALLVLTLVALMLTTQTASSSSPPDTAGAPVAAKSATGRPAAARALAWWVRRAPVVRLHHNEDMWPMSATTFINHSSLRWSHDAGCSDTEHAARGDVSAASLGDGVYTDREKTNAPGCNDKGDVWDSNDDVAPQEGGGPEDEAEGFFLDLDNAYRDGDGFNGDEPVYARFVSGQWVEYWFHYGNSNIDALNGVAHEGDWEHIAIRVNADNVPKEVKYFFHHESCTLSWANAPKVNGQPVIWSSENSHGSYPAGADPRWYDNISGSGERWDTQGNVDNLAAMAWWPYGGGWGEVGTTDETTGPQGPHPSRGVPTFTAARCDMT